MDESGVQGILSNLDNTLYTMQQERTEERSGEQRHLAIAITDLEKVIAYISFYLEDKHG